MCCKRAERILVKRGWKGLTERQLALFSVSETDEWKSDYFGARYVRTGGRVETAVRRTPCGHFSRPDLLINSERTLVSPIIQLSNREKLFCLFSYDVCVSRTYQQVTNKLINIKANPCRTNTVRISGITTALCGVWACYICYAWCLSIYRTYCIKYFI